jgi:hypothetical protein
VLPEGEQAKSGNFLKISAPSEIGERWMEKYFHFFFVFYKFEA